MLDISSFAYIQNYAGLMTADAMSITLACVQFVGEGGEGGREQLAKRPSWGTDGQLRGPWDC